MLTIRPYDPHRVPKAAGRHDGASMFSCLLSSQRPDLRRDDTGVRDDEKSPGSTGQQFRGAASDQVEHHNCIQDVGSLALTYATEHP
jgi:hypothetical protein